MCDCREKLEDKAAKHYPDIENAKATMSGFMLIPSGHQYLECEIEGTRTTSKGKIIKAKKTINVLGAFCMFCGDKFDKEAK